MNLCMYGWMGIGRHIHIYAWMDGNRQKCMNIYICVYVHSYIHTHACTHNVIPGNMSFNQKIQSDHRYKRTKMAQNKNICDFHLKLNRH